MPKKPQIKDRSSGVLRLTITLHGHTQDVYDRARIIVETARQHARMVAGVLEVDDRPAISIEQL